jgi:mRNA-degrading endonuclease RelE of RelBE toxin-antitoxin system
VSEVWTPKFAPSAVRDLDRLPSKIAAACVEFVTATLPTNPYRMSKPLTEELTGFHSARRGDYRILFELLEEDRVLHVVRVAHRADAYRPLR